MSEMKPWGYIHPEIENILRDKAAVNACITKKRVRHNTMPLYTADHLAEAVVVAMAERDLLIRDLRKELNERRYGRSAAK